MNKKVSIMPGHRAGPLKQSNKTHKTGKHRSKGSIDNLHKGRVSLKSSSKSKRNVSESKAARRNRLNQVRCVKKSHILEVKRSLGGHGLKAPPLLVALVPLSSEAEVAKLSELLKNSENENEVSNDHVASQRFKRRFHFVEANPDDLFEVLDLTKVCDVVLCVLAGSGVPDVKGERILSAMLAQGLPSGPLFAVQGQGLNKSEVKKVAKKWLEVICPSSGADKVFTVGATANAAAEAQLIMRQLGEQKRSKNSLRDHRSHLVAEQVQYDQESGLRLTGYVRGQVGWNVDRLVHIPGWGDFQVEKMEVLPDPYPLKQSGHKTMDVEDNAVYKPDPETMDNLVAENQPDCMEGEQTWPTEEELQEADEGAKKKRMVKVPKGTSDYQASWILDEVETEEDDENDDSEDDDDEDMEANDEDSMSDDEDEEQEQEDEEEVNTETDDEMTNYDEKHVNFAEETEIYAKMKEARADELFPDEVDTPIEVQARDRFQKYRGLKSFRTSPWDPKENLPQEYARIFQFENFQRTKKRVLEASKEAPEDKCVQVGSYVVLHLKGVEPHYHSGWVEQGQPQLVAFSMLKHEHKMSLMSVAVKRVDDGGEAISSKEKLVFHIGYRRFAACPIFSQHTNGDKHKYERFWRPGSGMVVMSMFAPITFPPANVLVYREMSSGRQVHVGTGSLLSMDPDRLVVKRAVLSGHPFKVHKRSAVVRFMFFNRQDIEWFKPVELRTKHGRRGHIREPLGTHGHMKVVLDGQVTQQDTVLMNLYKRVFPKWTYDPYVNRYVPNQKKKKEATLMDLM